MKRDELINSKEYWLTKIQLDLFNEVENYMLKNNLKRKDLAQKFGVSKGYISQILNGDADHRITKLIEISLGIGLAPVVTFKSLQEVSRTDVISSILKLNSQVQSHNHLALVKSLQAKDKEALEEIYNELSSNCEEQEHNCLDVAS